MPYRNERARSNRADTGQAVVEFALMLPLAFLVIMNVLNFGEFFFAGITVANAARTGVQYMIRAGSAALGSPAPTAPTANQIATNVIIPELSSLLVNNSSVAVRVCTRQWNLSSSAWVIGYPEGTAGCAVPLGSFATTPANPPADSSLEGESYVMAWVDVAYTYQPVIALGYQFMGISLTLPSNLVIHRQAVARMIQ
jgi:Flp pilus assembly protein TadG